jgi:SNF2 family DNA or RNA helicase
MFIRRALTTWQASNCTLVQVLILSFFKGGLDLLEGILVEDMRVDCARFDGDLDRKTSLAELERFKTDPNCRVLLATVQSGGVGLNITAANHVAFLDRWYNPFVHQQAEDRCHRIGQTKPVHVTYFDCAATIDEVRTVHAFCRYILYADWLTLS